MSIVCLKNPELLEIQNPNGSKSVGGSQYWYPKEGFIPPGACGATVASNALFYLLTAKKHLYNMAESTGLTGFSIPVSKTEFLEFMKKNYRFLYPRAGGLMAHHFEEGMLELANEYKLPIGTECLKIPISRSKRPPFEQVSEFLVKTLENDSPVAFLILSKGSVSVLDTWHWVTILCYDEENERAQITDNGNVFWADLHEWLETSIMGGAFVRLVEI